MLSNDHFLAKCQGIGAAVFDSDPERRHRYICERLYEIADDRQEMLAEIERLREIEWKYNNLG